MPVRWGAVDVDGARRGGGGLLKVSPPPPHIAALSAFLSKADIFHGAPALRNKTYDSYLQVEVSFLYLIN